MGSVLPKPILSKVVDRVGSADLYAGCCSVNGYRTSMEDAHFMKITPDRMVFGIFDGHSNEKCSRYIAESLPKKLLAESLEALASDPAVIEGHCLAADAEYLSMSREGGSTGTFCIIDRQRMKLIIGNVGDSRTMLVRGGKIVFVTSDHKPLNPEEKARIEEAGGWVRMNRVDGDLAVSRAFGDGQFKGGDKPRKQKVIAVPDVTVLDLEKNDVIVLACDGVFEGNFPNDEVATFVTENLPAVKANGNCGDIAVTAARVCDNAIRKGSKDNISCMVIHLADGSSHVSDYGEASFVPGPPFPKNHEASKAAYSKMAEMAQSHLPDALRLRYKLYKAHLEGTLATMPDIAQVAFDLCDEVDINAEGQFFGAGPAGGEDDVGFFVALAEGTR